MPRIKPIDSARATGATAEALAGVRAKLGGVPNMFATLANAPAALQFYLRGAEALATGRFSARQREIVAVAVAEANACGYCLAAHNALGAMVGLKPADVEAARAGSAHDPRDAALAALAQAIVRTRGHPTGADLAAAQAGGLDDADVLETIAVVALNVFTNYTNHIAGTEIDFPQLAARKAA